MPDKRGIQSVDAAVAILNAVAAAAGPQPLTAIAKRTSNSASTTHRYLVSLQRGGLVRQDPNTGRYDLGPAALQLGLAALKRMDAVEVAQTHAARLAMETGKTCFVSIWSDDGPMIVRWFHGQRIIMTMAGVGSVLPLLESSSGLIFAAYLPDYLMKSWMARHKLAFDDVEAELQRIRSEGFAWVDSRMVTGLRGVSVPVLDMFAEVRLTLTLLSPDPQLVDFPNDAQRQLLSAGQQASSQLGYGRPDKQTSRVNEGSESAA
ncbi:MAG: IclR family transcriptional regulator [Burkholderiales bacterium]|nr:IclR family transcriptional regulator [Burkholderiales bacterium]